MLTVDCKRTEHTRPYRLFKRALHERPGVLSVDAVTGDGHQVPPAGHGVTQEGKVAVVHVGTVEGDDVVQLPLQSLADRLDTEHLREKD